VLNAASEVCTLAFLESKISFGEIVLLTEKVVRGQRARTINCLADVFQADGEAREAAQALIR
jgi:1-deoxy-D-xylulose 5-phosphate reductoisomerase